MPVPPRRLLQLHYLGVAATIELGGEEAAGLQLFSQELCSAMAATAGGGAGPSSSQQRL